MGGIGGGEVLGCPIGVGLPNGHQRLGGGSLSLEVWVRFIYMNSDENFIECSRSSMRFHGLPSHSMVFYDLNFCSIM